MTENNKLCLDHESLDLSNPSRHLEWSQLQLEIYSWLLNLRAGLPRLFFSAVYNVINTGKCATLKRMANLFFI